MNLIDKTTSKLDANLSEIADLTAEINSLDIDINEAER